MAKMDGDDGEQGTYYCVGILDNGAWYIAFPTGGSFVENGGSIDVGGVRSV